MSDTNQPIDLQTLFTESAQQIDADAFTSDVMAGTERLRRRKVLLRIGLGMLLALLVPPLQDFGLAVTEILLISLVSFEGGLLAELLAPVNTVGTVVSFALFGMRAFYRQLFRYVSVGDPSIDSTRPGDFETVPESIARSCLSLLLI